MQIDQLPSVLGGMLHTVDNNEFQFPSSRFQLESKLFLKRRKDAGCWVRTWPCGFCWCNELRESEVEVEAAAQACLVHDRPIGVHRKHACERSNSLTATKN